MRLASNPPCLPTQAFGFGTGLRTILLKNLPPATFFKRKMPPWSSNLSIEKNTDTITISVFFLAEKERSVPYAQFQMVSYNRF